MNLSILLWAAATAFAAGALLTAGAMLLIRPARRARTLPSQWPLRARSVFNADERRAYRRLREALPQYLIAPRLSLLRLCEPDDPRKTRPWAELIGLLQVSFALCTVHGRVIAVIDVEGTRAPSPRHLEIKRHVLTACGIPYHRLRADALPDAPALRQLLVAQTDAVPPPSSAAAVDIDLDAHADEARDALARAVARRRAERIALWQEASTFGDSIAGIVTDHPNRLPDTGGRLTG